MASISSRLSALCDKIQILAAPGTDMALRHLGMACICIAMHNLGNAAPSSRTTRMRKPVMTPISTSQFVVDQEEGVTGPIGEGDRAFVLKVSHHVTGKTFAVKVHFQEPHEEGDEEEEAAIFNLRVLREACFMAACRGHPSLVRFYTVCQYPVIDRYCGLVMEHVGPSLHEVLAHQRRGQPFREHEVRRMMRQVVSGAKAMHDRGIVHRGINPENVLVGAGGDVVKIGGFGQAKCISKTDDVLPRRAPPEVLLKGRGPPGSDELVDSWSIGCLMAELLIGKPLFAVTDDEYEADAADQLHMIFGVIGVPDKRTMKDMKPRDFNLAKEVRKMRDRRRGVRKLRRDSRLRKLVPPEVLSDDGFMVLQGLLTCNPKNRLTAGAALQLPWFANNNSPAAPVSQQIISGSSVFTWLLVSVLALLLFVVFVCVGSRN